jgi:methionyl-tRNA formyltransferase
MAEPVIVVFAYHDVGYACLDVLIRRGGRIAAVFTHDDNPNESIFFRSVARLAREHGITVHTPENINAPEWVARIRALQPELIFSFYYRNMICQAILDLPRLGAVNMHGSLLPKYRGRVPINWAILNGETQTGATLHYMVRRADAGDIVDQEAVPIGPDETAQEVFAKVRDAAVRVLERQFDALCAGRAPRREQDESQASYFGGRKPDDGRIDWTLSARQIYNLIRAVTHPYPGAFTEVDGRRLLIWWARPAAEAGGPGEVLSVRPLRIGTGAGSLEIRRFQWQGEAEEDAAAGNHGLHPGQKLGNKSTLSARQGAQHNNGDAQYEP